MTRQDKRRTTGRRAPNLASRFEIERRIVGENRALELAGSTSRLDTEFIYQLLARPPIDVECLRLPARSVERKHQLRAETFAKRMLDNQLLELADELCVTAERKLRLDPVLERSESDLLQSRNRNLRELFIGEIGKRCSTPKRKSLLQ